MFKFILAAFAVYAVYFFHQIDERKALEAKQPPVKVYNPTEVEITAKMAGVDLRPYDRKTYPKAWAQIGPLIKSGEFQALRVSAARSMASRFECDKVGLVEHSLTRSTPSNPVVFADCENGLRGYFSLDGPLEMKPGQSPHLPAAR